MDKGNQVVEVAKARSDPGLLLFSFQTLDG
jgi:hypothetical protein